MSKKSLICLKGKSVTPRRGKYLSIPLIPATPLDPWALASPHALLPDLQSYKYTVRCGVLGAGLPTTQSKTTGANLVISVCMVSPSPPLY